MREGNQDWGRGPWAGASCSLLWRWVEGQPVCWAPACARGLGGAWGLRRVGLRSDCGGARHHIRVGQRLGGPGLQLSCLEACDFVSGSGVWGELGGRAGCQELS